MNAEINLMNNPFNLTTLSVDEAKELCNSNGFRSKVVISGYKNKTTTVEPIGAGKEDFINNLIEQRFFILNGGILCR